MSPVFRQVFLIVTLIVWGLPFVRRSVRGEQQAVTVVRAARWGMLIEAAGFLVVFTHGPKALSSPWPVWRFALALLLALAGILLSHAAVRNLGRQWRLDSGLNADHELVRTGP